MLKKLGTKGLSWTLIVTAVLFMAAGAQAQSKVEIGAEIDSLAQQIVQLKPNRNDPAIALQLDIAVAQYLTLVSQLSYDPLNLRPSAANFAASAKVAPAAPPGGASTTTNFANNTPEPIVDMATTTSTIDVSGVDSYLLDLDMTTAITHTWSADLDMTLTSPSGTVATIGTGNGGSNDDVYNGTTFDDSASEITTDTTYANGVTSTPLVPEGAMGAFIGEDPNGTWTFEIFDSANADTGTLNSWSLDVTTLDAPPIETTTNFANNTPEPIVDMATATSTIDVSGVDNYLCDVDLTAAITHTWNADLQMTLTSPGGTVSTVGTGNGGSNDDVYNGTTFNDAATETVTDFVYANGVAAGSLVPEGAMGAFVGEDPNGTWTFEIFDSANADTGTLNSWNLDVTSCVGVVGSAEPIPTTGGWGMLLFLLGLAAAGVALLLSRRLL